jgi:NAD(P)-dependent dehydrogenase (short-subunit alcohol dehydrogenase family)
MVNSENSPIELAGKVAVVTGGARGIGQAIAKRFLQAGATVIIGDVRAEDAAETARDLAAVGRIKSAALDVRDWELVGAFFRTVAAEHGRLDVSVNNAGIGWTSPSLEMPQHAWDQVLDVNLSGLFACAQAAGRIMVQQGFGSIVNLASSAAVLGIPGRAPYCASKAGVIALTKVLGTEWISKGVRVNAIGPAWVATDMIKEAIEAGNVSEEIIRLRTPLGRPARPDEIAEVALFLASDRSSYFTGQTLFPDGGYTAYAGWR